MPDINMDLHKEIKSAGKGINEGKIKFILIFLKIILKYSVQKQKLVTMYCVFIVQTKVKF